MVTPLVALTIAGTDSGGGAGIAADLATFAAHGLHGTSVVTAVTAQDTTSVHGIHPVPLEVVAAQLDAVLSDLGPAVIKTGMLASVDVAYLVAGWCAGSRARPLVVDPVLRSTTGVDLADESLLAALRGDLLRAATVVTPNAAEARALLGLPAGDVRPSRDLAVALADELEGPAVIVTGGPEGARRSSCTDWLVTRGARPIAVEHPAVETSNDHGTGCTHASALAAQLALGADLPTAARAAAAYVARQLTASSGWSLGAGRGPVAHLHPDPRTTKEMSA